MPLSCSERLERLLEAISNTDNQGDAIYTRLYAESARQSACAADQRARSGKRLGPLDGVLFSVKDSTDIQGHTTLAGSPLLQHLPAAAADAAVVAQLKNAGAVVVGSTHMTELAFSGIGLNPKLKLLRNPLDPARVTGGSSSGAAASVAANLAEIALAGDTGGSIRIPAALCGAVGFKPSHGKISTQGIFPLSRTLDVIGPIARSVRQCADTFHTLTGYRHQWHEPLPKPKLVVVGGLASIMDTQVANVFSRAIMQLARTDYVLEDDDFAMYWEAIKGMDRTGVFTVPELLSALREVGVTDIEGVDPMISQRIAAYRSMTAVDYVSLSRQRQQHMATMDNYLADGRMLVLPTVPCIAPEIDSLTTTDAQFETTARLVTNCRFANLFDLPSITIPLPTAGPAVGLMLVSTRGSDGRLLAAAQRVETLLAE
jgi:aspartyl-tRNA(Asn)/glutamyl-tRNA(Gln) amidotransferase subunit A